VVSRETLLAGALEKKWRFRYQVSSQSRAVEKLCFIAGRRRSKPIGENEMPNVWVGTGKVTGQTQVGGTTWYSWTFPAVVDGQEGIITVMDQSNDPANEPAIQNTATQVLQDDPGKLEGIAENGGDTGDDGGGTVAGNDGGDDGGDAGDSV
jgi:hypothetical protein